MKNKIGDLRNHLFATLEDLRDPDTEIDMDRVDRIVDVSNAIIDTAKTEVQFLKVTGSSKASDFLQLESPTD